MRLGLPLALAASLALSPSASAADTAAEAAVKATAIQIAQEGATAYSAGRYYEAVTKFEEAYRKFPAHILLLNLSRGQMKIGRCMEALDSARKFMFLQPELAKAKDTGPWIASIERDCPSVDVTSDPPGASVWMDRVADSALGVTPFQTRGLAGPHVLIATLKGCIDARRDVTLEPGKTATAALSLAPEGAPVIVPAPGAKESVPPAPPDELPIAPPEQPVPTPVVAAKVEPPAPPPPPAPVIAPPEPVQPPEAKVELDIPTASAPAAETVPAAALAPAPVTHRSNTGAIILWTSIGVVGAAALAVGGYFIFRDVIAPPQATSATLHGAWQ